MSLFFTGHSAKRIMLLWRWKSTAFLDYIRPQIVEWCALFSTDMIEFNDFFELLSPKPNRMSKSRGQHFEIPNGIASPRKGRWATSGFKLQTRLVEAG